MTLTEQIAHAYELPLGQAEGIVFMIKAKIAAEREECALVADAFAAACTDERHRELLSEVSRLIRSRGGP